MRRKKAQIQSNVVLYAIVGVVIVILLIAAVKAISDFKKRQNEILVRQFEEDLTEVTATIEFGSVEESNLQLPSDVNEVCFVDLNKREEILKSPLINRFPAMKNSIESGVRKNVFMIAGNEVKDSMYGGDICSDHYPYFICMETARNVLNIYLEGKGRCALIVQESAPCAEFDANPTTTTEDISLKTTAAELKIPSGTAITFPGSETKICMEPIIPPSPFDEDPDGLITEVYSITPEGTTLNAFFTMKYYLELLPPNLNPDNIKMKYHETEDIWTKLQNPELDTGKKTITNSIISLRKYAVFGPEPPIAVIKIIKTKGPPLQHYPQQEQYFFGVNEEIEFDASDSYDEDGDGIISAYWWDFGDEAASNQVKPKHAYAEFGTYTLTLTVTDSDDNEGASTAILSIINTNNVKDTQKYGNILFLISKSDSWRSIMQAIPLTMWTGNNEAGSNSRVEKPYVVYDGTLSAGELTKIMDEHSATKAAFFNTVPSGISGEHITRISPTSYFTYWSGFEDIVLVDYNNRDAALTSSLFASSINAPIIFINNANKDTYSNYIQGRNVYIIGSLDSTTDAYVRQKASKVTSYTLAQVSVPPKNPFPELYIEIIPSNALS